MSPLLAAALFFIIWWLAFFAMLPFGMRTQDDEGDVTLGTVSSAPNGPHVFKTVLRATLLALLISGGLYVLTETLGFGFDDLPRMVPDFSTG